LRKKSSPIQAKGPRRDEAGLTSKELDEILSWRPPKRKPRIYADVDVPRYLIEYARYKLKWDVIWVNEHSELVEQHDYFHFNKARQLKRILLSLDEGFLSDKRFKLHETEGLIVFSSPSKSKLDNLVILIHVNEFLVDALRRNSQALRGIKIKATTNGLSFRMLSKNSKKICRFIPW